MKTGNDLLATYYYGFKHYDVYGCYDNETPEGEYDFYDVVENGLTINEGDPFYEFPTRNEIIEMVKFEDEWAKHRDPEDNF